MNYAKKAWMLNKIISAMNDEEAYYDNWIWLWPDGEDYEECEYDFGNKEDYEELERAFIYAYKTSHKYGLYKADEETLKAARNWDEKLNLEPIKNLG